MSLKTKVTKEIKSIKVTTVEKIVIDFLGIQEIEFDNIEQFDFTGDQLKEYAQFTSALVKEDVTIKSVDIEYKEVKQYFELYDYSYAEDILGKRAWVKYGNNDPKYGAITVAEGSRFKCEVIEENLAKIHVSELPNRIEILDVLVKSTKTGQMFYTQSRFLRKA